MTGRAWNSRPAVKGQTINRNAVANRKAIQGMSDCEIQTSMTADELKAFHAVQKARVLASIRREGKRG